MAIPTMLPAPEPVTQGPQTCWAAAFESWQTANGRFTGIEPRIDQNQLIEWFGREEGLVYETGRATPTGMGVMAAMSMMDLRALRPSYITAERLAILLEAGYLYVVYLRRPATPAHAVVCYGVDHTHIHLMDPWPDRGLVTREHDFFTSMTEGIMWVGIPMDVILARGVGNALQVLQPPPPASSIR